MASVKDQSGSLWASATTLAGRLIESLNRTWNKPRTKDSGQRIALLGQCILNVMDDDFQAILKEKGQDNIEILNWSAPGVAVKHLTSEAYLQSLVTAIKENKIDTLVVFKGGNDLLQGRPIDQIKHDLDTFLTKMKTSGAAILLVGVRSEDMKKMAQIMKYPATYMQEAEAMFASLAEKHQLPLYSSFFKGLERDDYLNIKQDYREILASNPQFYDYSKLNGVMELSNALFDLQLGMEELHPNHKGQAKIATGMVDFMKTENLIAPPTPKGVAHLSEPSPTR